MLAAVKPELRNKLNRWSTALFYAALVGGLAVLTSHPTLRDEKSVVTIRGQAQSVVMDEADAVFRLSSQPPNYRIAEPDPAVVAALRNSERSGNSISLHVHLNGARFAEFSDTPEFWVESAEHLGKSYGPFHERIRWSWRAMSAAQASLLRGLAFDEALHYEDAVKALDVALAGGLGDGKRALAYRTRGDALESLAYPPGRRLNDRDDALLARALGDFRRAAQLDPSDFRAVGWQGAINASLGAYQEALAVYEDVARRWPDQYFQVAISRGATFRQMGDYGAALRELDTLVKEHGPQDGMKFHYHRGWTLNKLARYAEAEKEFTAGMANQPDYLWAFAKRACAYAQQGDIAHAVNDQRRAVELWDDVKRDATAISDADTRARLDSVLQNLEAALRTAPRTPSAAACVDLFEGPTLSHREKSRQYPPG
jgi:tetratricopeptide (TPR) repeat protein